MANETHGLWLPREVLTAVEIPPSDDPQMSRIFRGTPWANGNLSYTRVRYRNERGEVNRVVGSWAPTALLPLSMLADCDDERILGSLLETKDRRAIAVYSDDSVSILGASEKNAAPFELEDTGTFLIHCCFLYCNALDEPLLCQCTAMTPDHRIFLRRAIDFGVRQGGGSAAADDLLGGGDR